MEQPFRSITVKLTIKPARTSQATIPAVESDVASVVDGIHIDIHADERSDGGYDVTITFSTHSTDDAQRLAQQIAGSLHQLGWSITSVEGIERVEPTTISW
ncbi:MAG TPA: hypothetical protein VMW80_00040 [Candidatus Dormibacteraeota bacterium]|nr:hypothetical protein [Candidatus Dormibacteraeota bacterium]